MRITDDFIIYSPGRHVSAVLRARARVGQGAEGHREVEESDGCAVAHAGQRLVEEEAALAGGGIPPAESDTAHRALKRE